MIKDIKKCWFMWKFYTRRTILLQIFIHFLKKVCFDVTNQSVKETNLLMQIEKFEQNPRTNC